MGVSKIAPDLAIFVLFNNQKLPCLLGSIFSIHLSSWKEYQTGIWRSAGGKYVKHFHLYSPSLDSHRGNINEHHHLLSKCYFIWQLTWGDRTSVSRMRDQPSFHDPQPQCCSCHWPQWGMRDKDRCRASYPH